MTDLERAVKKYNQTWVNPHQKGFLPFCRFLYHLPMRTLRYLKRKVLSFVSRRTPAAPTGPSGEALLSRILPTEEEKERQRQHVFREPHMFSVIVPLYNTEERFLREMIESVTAQTYGNWELCMADGSDDAHSEVEKIVREYQAKDPRIKYQKLTENKGIAENTNACLSLSTGDFIGLFDHDDVLHPSALFECQKAAEEEGADCIYTDELTFLREDLSAIQTIHLKPDFAPFTLTSVNYICHFSAFRKSLLQDNGLYQKAYDGSQDHDMILRITHAAKKVYHIKKVLYFWRVHPGSVSSGIDAKEYAIDAGKRAVRDAEKRKGRTVSVDSVKVCATHYRLHYQPEREPHFDTIFIEETDTGETLQKKIKASNADYLFFQETGTEPVPPTDVLENVHLAMLSEAGLISGRIVDPDGLVLESGFILGDFGKERVLMPEGGLPFDDGGYTSRNYYVHNVSAATLSTSAVSREKLLSVGGLSPRLKTPEALGIDLSLKLFRAGFYNAVNPYVIFVKKQGAERKLTSEELSFLEKTYPDTFAGMDPFYHPLLKKDGSFIIDL